MEARVALWDGALDAVRATARGGAAPHRAESVMAAYLEQQEGTVGNVDAEGAVR